MDAGSMAAFGVMLVMALGPALVAFIWGRVDTYGDDQDRYW
jgi:hypothetical protein